MKEAMISVGEAAEHLKDFVDRVRAESVSFVISENGAPVARLVPEGSKFSTGRELALAMADLNREECDLAEWSEQLDSARKNLIPPPYRWSS
jgi:prevent-host-death family protein